MTNNEIYLDEKSGISIEEQKDILTQINGIAEKNRRQLSDEKIKIEAKKKGAIFPLTVNIAAVVLLVSGILILVLLNVRIDAQLRTGNEVYNLTEQAIIEEIRRDTAEKISAKEIEIANIASRLKEVDTLLLQMQSDNQVMTLDQLTAHESLLILQKSYRDELAILHEERAQILENSHSRELNIRVSREGASQRTLSELETELERLLKEQERKEALDALFSGGLAAFSGQLFSWQPEQIAQSELMARNSQLEETISEMQKTIDAIRSGSSGQELRLSELEVVIASLRNTNTLLEQDSADKNRTITSLQTENINLTSSNTSLSSQITELRSTNLRLERDLANLRDNLLQLLQE